jgi:hypothetical protein
MSSAAYDLSRTYKLYTFEWLSLSIIYKRKTSASSKIEHMKAIYQLSLMYTKNSEKQL